MNSDYIIRIIEQFIQAIVAIVKARKAGNYEEAFHQIQNASQRYLQTDVIALLNKTPEQLIEHFKNGTKYFDAEQCVFCADLLYQTALICEAKQCEDLSLHAKILCLHLYLNAIPTDKQFQTQDYMDRVDGLIKDLECKVVPDSVKEVIPIYRKTLNQKFS